MLKHWMGNMTHYCRHLCTSLQPVNHYLPYFSVPLPGSSGPKINAARPVVANAVHWDVMCQSNQNLSAAPLKLSNHNTRNWSAAGTTISCRHRSPQNPLNAVTRTICRYTASQKHTVVREGGAEPDWSHQRTAGTLYDVVRIRQNNRS